MVEQAGLQREHIESAFFVSNEAKPQATDPNVQAIWDRRNAQGQAAGYDTDAKPEDYPQVQQPMVLQESTKR